MTRIEAQHGAQLVRAVLPMLILTLISEHESYGYELVERLDTLGVSAGTGLVYPVLNRLERDGLITARTGVSNNGPPRKYLTITAAGEGARTAAIHQWQSVALAVQNASNSKGASDAKHFPS
jgi:PadR family transcriptional regulator PadR